MRIYNLLIILLGLVFAGCTVNEGIKLCPESTEVKVVEKYITVKCQIPEVTCDFSGTNMMPVRKLIDCIKLHKDAIALCNETIDEQAELDGTALEEAKKKDSVE